MKPIGCLALLAFLTMAAGVTAQTIPASSADSGRRAVIAVDQATINNNINNAWNYANSAYSTATWAVSIGQGAQGTADDAKARAIAAQTQGGGLASPVMNSNTRGAIGVASETFACIWGYGGGRTQIQVYNDQVYLFNCPAGSAIAVFSSWTPTADNNGGDGGSGGGGGGGGG